MSHNIDEERIYGVETQGVRLKRLTCEGWILDIGGGGEGIIGQLNGEQVVAIDRDREELKEAAAGPLKLVMDGGQMSFLAEQFNMVTSFFTMMYMDYEDKERVFKEVYRVLKPGGQFLLWDVRIPPYNKGKKDIYAVPLKVELENKVIETGYGVVWPGKEQDLDLYLDLARGTGFRVEKQREEDLLFHLKLSK